MTSSTTKGTEPMDRPNYVYVASSWRNPLQQSVVEAIRDEGIGTYDFRNPRPGDSGFSWRDVDPIEDPPVCESCRGSRTYRGERCGCGQGIRHAVDCGRPARPCPDCRSVPRKGDDLVSLDRYLRMIDHPRALVGFENDFDAMKAADVFVLVLPCGRSAHLELGWAIGAGKRTAILLEDPAEPELMYRLADFLATDLEELLEWLLTGSETLWLGSEVRADG